MYKLQEGRIDLLFKESSLYKKAKYYACKSMLHFSINPKIIETYMYVCIGIEISKLGDVTYCYSRPIHLKEIFVTIL